MERESGPFVVIGGGLGGLSVASLLAAAGREVLLFERGQRSGGRAAGTSRAGFELDLGAHLVVDGGPLRALRGRLGIEAQLLPVPPAEIVMLHQGRPRRLPASRRSLLCSAALAFPARLRLLALLRSAARGELTRWAEISFGAWLREHGADDALVELVLRVVALPTQAGSTADLSTEYVLSMLRVIHSEGGLLQLQGGWGRLMQRLHQTALDRGVQIRLGEPVREILIADGRVVGVRTSRGPVSAAAVVCALPPQRLVGLVAEDTPVSATFRQWSRLEPLGLLGLDVALRTRTGFPASVLFDLDQQVLIHDPGRLDPTRVPPGAQLLQLLAPVSAREAADSRVRLERYAAMERLLDRLRPEWRQALVFARRLRCPLAVSARRAYSQPRSALPRPEMLASLGLYCVGDGVGAAGELGGVAISSALAVADHISANAA